MSKEFEGEIEQIDANRWRVPAGSRPDMRVDGIIYASDSFQDWVAAFNPDGTPREVIGTYGEELGEFSTATGVIPAANIDRLLAASANSSSVQVFVTSSDPVPADQLPLGTIDPSKPQSAWLAATPSKHPSCARRRL